MSLKKKMTTFYFIYISSDIRLDFTRTTRRFADKSNESPNDELKRKEKGSHV